jgi:hypothetical protein
MPSEFTSDADNKLKQELLDLAKSISNYVLALENEIDRNMLNAAIVLYEADRISGGRLTLADFEKNSEWECQTFVLEI